MSAKTKTLPFFFTFEFDSHGLLSSEWDELEDSKRVQSFSFE